MKWLSVLVAGVRNRLADCKKKNSYDSLLECENPQICYALSFLYTHDSKKNNYYQSEEILNVLQNLIRKYISKGSNAISGSRRHMCPLIQTYHLMKNYLDDFETELKLLINEFAKTYFGEIKNRENLTIFSSANIGYGTNHLAVELSGLCAYAKYFESEDIFDNLGIADLKNYLKSFFEKFMNDMHPDGYWAECDGPATGYNGLTLSALHKSAYFLDVIDKYRDQFVVAAEYYNYAVFPNLENNLILDGRMLQYRAEERISAFCFSPSSRSIYEVCMEDLERRISDGEVFSGESLNNLTNDLVLGDLESSDCSDGFITAKDMKHQFGENFGFIKKNGWIISCCNLKFIPRPEGHWNLDYQNLFSIYNDHFGCVVNGGHSKNDPELSTFSKQFMSFDGYPLEEPMSKFIPHSGHFNFEDNGLNLFREYRGFEGLLSFVINNENEMELIIQANTRLDEYPIDFNFMLPLSYGEFLKSSNQSILLGDKIINTSVSEIGDTILFEPEENHNLFKKCDSKRMRIKFPSSAEFSWGFKRFDTYNLKTDRHEDIKDSVCICKIPIGVESEKITFNLDVIDG
ncbi:MAG: hypothetical protein COA79_16395 [Planctomycetota bacterium]|nr:MAG: hypothetical protein COA79_16395 [Planctomycetota bacterium]